MPCKKCIKRDNCPAELEYGSKSYPCEYFVSRKIQRGIKPTPPHIEVVHRIKLSTKTVLKTLLDEAEKTNYGPGVNCNVVAELEFIIDTCDNLLTPYNI